MEQKNLKQVIGCALKRLTPLFIFVAVMNLFTFYNIPKIYFIHLVLDLMLLSVVILGYAVGYIDRQMAEEKVNVT
jgi:hypothetical protein